MNRILLTAQVSNKTSGMYMIVYGYIVTFGNHGCVCGEVNKALLYVIDNEGVDTWDGYPSGGDPYRSKVISMIM